MLLPRCLITSSASPKMQPYAPTAYAGSSISRSQRTESILDQEIKLYTSTKQRELYESLAEIHAIIVTLDFLEKAFLRDSIDHSEYTPTCLRLIAQYNGMLKNEAVSKEFVSLERFKERYGLEYDLGIERLKAGIPVTLGQAVSADPAPVPSGSNDGNSSGNSGGDSSARRSIKGGAKSIAEITGNLITCMDAVKLKYRAKDQLHPLLSEIVVSLNRITSEGSDFTGKGKLVQWLITLNGLKVDEEITDDQARELLFDLETTYKEFYTSLE